MIRNIIVALTWIAMLAYAALMYLGIARLVHRWVP